MLEVDHWPAVRDPILIAVFMGWVDAGYAGAGALQHLLSQLEPTDTFAKIDLSELADLQQSRPTIKLEDGLTRLIEWPAVNFVVGHVGEPGRDLIICHGPEPSMRWGDFAAEVVNLAKRLGVKLGIMLGGMPAPVTHRTPLQVHATATKPSLFGEFGPIRTDYTGPTGMQTVLQVSLGEAGIGAVGLWAQVPPYLSATPSPPAMQSLLEALERMLDVTLQHEELDEQCESYYRQINEQLDSRPELIELIEQLAQTESEDLPSGEEIAAEIEKFLRGESGDYK